MTQAANPQKANGLASVQEVVQMMGWLLKRSNVSNGALVLVVGLWTLVGLAIGAVLWGPWST